MILAVQFCGGGERRGSRAGRRRGEGGKGEWERERRERERRDGEKREEKEKGRERGKRRERDRTEEREGGKGREGDKNKKRKREYERGVEREREMFNTCLLKQYSHLYITTPLKHIIHADIQHRQPLRSTMSYILRFKRKQHDRERKKEERRGQRESLFSTRRRQRIPGLGK